MYTTEKNCQIVIALLKKYGIRRIIANPGTTNIAFVGSVQSDPFFMVYSGVDERHSAYMACGMAAETGEPVVLSCTGATASRNYLPALTEAYYRKLPVVALTSSQVMSHLGQMHPQMIDRTTIQNDVAKVSVHIPIIKDEDDFKLCEREVNRALLELERHGGGPVHINMETNFPREFTVEELPDVRKIERHFSYSEKWPEIRPDTKIAIWIGARIAFQERTRKSIEEFIGCHQAVVLTDWTSNYEGSGKITAALLTSQCHVWDPEYEKLKPDLIIHMGEISADYFTQHFLSGTAPVWRLSPSGEIADLLGKLDNVFEMPEYLFFEHYNQQQIKTENKYSAVWYAEDRNLRNLYPDLPFGNAWIAGELSRQLPENSVLHMGILSTVRSFGYNIQKKGISAFCNTGGFGIDGNTSTLVGASLTNPEKLYFGMFGDLSFFYDLNSIGNRHIGNNIRLLVVNNGQGGEFSLYDNPGAQFGEHTADYVAAGRHFGKKSKELIKNYAEALGFRYMTASSKEELLSLLPEFIKFGSDRSILLECFVDMSSEVGACELLKCIKPEPQVKPGLKQKIGQYLPENVKKVLRKVVP